MTTNVTTPVLYALGTVTTVFSFTIILGTLGIMMMLGRRQAKIR
jgi:putative spermidine/putrescine transport system permease protein